MSDTDYKVRARGKWDWRDFDTVRLEISVGQTYHEGAKLRAAMDWARDNFAKRVIILGDATQRYNLMFRHGLSEEDAYAAALQAGTDWLARNRQYLSGIEIKRWDEWKQHPEYETTSRQVLDLYNANDRFHFAVQEAISEFWDRRHADGFLDRKAFFSLSETYLLEETAVFSVAYDSLDGISAYPGDFLEMWEMFISSEEREVPAGLRKAHCVRLSFQRKKEQKVSATLQVGSGHGIGEGVGRVSRAS